MQLKTIFLFIPEDIAVDKEGNKYVLDAGNYRIVKFDNNWNFIRTIGRQGKGPGELSSPVTVDIDSNGNIHVIDQGNQRIQVYNPDGSSHTTLKIENFSGKGRLLNNGSYVTGGGFNSGLIRKLMENQDVSDEPILDIYYEDFKPIKQFGVFRDLGEPNQNMAGSNFSLAIDKYNNTYIAFKNRNRIEKYNPEGLLELRIERILNFEEFVPAPKTEKVNQGG